MSIPTEFEDRFTTKEQLSERPSGSVWKADDSKNAQEVALKIFSKPPKLSDGLKEAFQVEVNALKAAQHDNLAKVISGGCQDDWFYLAMELVQGKTLRDHLKEESGPLEISKAIDIAAGVADGLEAIRAVGSYHGDLDSRAIILDGHAAKLAGYASHSLREARKSSNITGEVVLDVAYASPEQLSGSGKIDHRSDIYALSVLLFEMVTGQKPFVADNPLQAAMLRMSQEPPSPSKFNSAVSAQLDAAVVKGLARDPESRFGSFAEFKEAIMVRTPSATASSTVESPAPKKAEAPQRMAAGSETVAMSTDAIKDMLKAHEKASNQSEASSPVIDEGQTAEMPMPHARTVGLEGRLDGSKEEDGDSTESDDADSSDSVSTAAETRVNMATDEMLAGSFIMLAGPRRGERFPLFEDQMLIGSDSGCDISLAGKDIPSRYAIIVRRDSEYFVGPLSGKGLEVNGEPVEGSSEQQLQRGDIVNVGPHQLRFVAPGEVFTLQKEAADRVIDREPNKVTFAAKIITGVVAALCLVIFFVFQSGFSDREAASKKKDLSETAKRKSVIAKLREEGDVFLKEGKLIEPIGANARKRFEQILELDPDDTYAKRRITEIKERAKSLKEDMRRRAAKSQQVAQLLEQANNYFKKGNFVSPPGANAKEAYEAVLRLDSGNELAQSRLEKVNNVLTKLLSRVNTMLKRADEYRQQGKITAPPGANAYETLREILNLDPQNREALDMLLDMAAESIYAGDRAKSRANAQSMKRSYIQAQALGVDPQYLAPRIKGVELMKKSRASVIIYDGKDGEPGSTVPTDKTGFLSTAEIERRLAALKLRGDIDGAGDSDRFIDLQKK